MCSPRGRTGAAGSSAGGGTAATPRPPRAAKARSAAPSHGGLRVRHETRAVDDGFRSPLVAGLRASEDARRLAEEIGFACGRLSALAAAPPGLYGEARAIADIEEATWLCFLIAYLSPTEGDDPFEGIRSAMVPWSTGELPDLEGVALGPHTSHDPARGSETLQAYRAWAERAGSQEQAYSGDPNWTAERRFERVFERLALPGFGRLGRFDLLVTLSRLGIYDLRADSLHLVGSDQTVTAAKRVFGIGDRMNMEYRARDLATAAQVPLEALDLALANWNAPQRATLGIPADASDEPACERVVNALGL